MGFEKQKIKQHTEKYYFTLLKNLLVLIYSSASAYITSLRDGHDTDVSISSSFGSSMYSFRTIYFRIYLHKIFVKIKDVISPLTSGQKWPYYVSVYLLYLPGLAYFFLELVSARYLCYQRVSLSIVFFRKHLSCINNWLFIQTIGRYENCDVLQCLAYITILNVQYNGRYEEYPWVSCSNDSSHAQPFVWACN